MDKPNQPIAWISAESLGRLKQGGNDSRGTVPVHAKQSRAAKVPLFVATHSGSGSSALPEPAAWQRLVNDPDDAPHFYWEECSKWEAENCAPKSDLRQLYTADQMHAYTAAKDAEIAQLREDADNWRKTAEYFRAGQEQRAPRWVPSKVRLDGPVRGDYPIGHTTIANDGVHKCKSNRYGAVSVLASNGQWLGVRPCEFEVVEWRDNVPDAARKGEA